MQWLFVLRLYFERQPWHSGSLREKGAARALEAVAYSGGRGEWRRISVLEDAPIKQLLAQSSRARPMRIIAIEQGETSGTKERMNLENSFASKGVFPRQPPACLAKVVSDGDPTMSEIYTVVGGTVLHVLLTVLVVDRLLRYHENRKWRRVHGLLLVRLQMACGDLLDCWANWLDAVNSHGTLGPNSPGIKETERAADLPLSEFVDMCRFCAKDVQLPDSEALLIDHVLPANIAKALEHHLLARELAQSDPGWPSLVTSLSQTLDRVAEILSRLSREDPYFSEALEQMYLMLTRIDPKRLPMEVWEDSGVRQARAQEIAHTIGETISMRKYIRTMVGAGYS